MLSYDEYKKAIQESAKIDFAFDVEELKKENEDILKSFLESR